MHNFHILNAFPEWRPRRVSPRVDRLNQILERLGLWVRLMLPPAEDMTNVEQRMNLYHLLAQVLAYEVPGDIVELGCHNGKSSVLIRRILDDHASDRAFHVFDSFEGLPERHEKDATDDYVGGQLATSEAKLRRNFEQRGLTVPTIHKGWFDATLPQGLPDDIAFAYLDGDFYESILVSLEHVYPRLTRGAVCLIDDYCDPDIYPDGWNKLPGVKAACDEFLADKPESMTYLYSGHYSHGFFRKI